MAKRDYYEVLGVAKDASEKDLKDAYRRLAMRYHPDRNPDDKEKEEKFKEAKEAYEVLSDPSKRQAYDQFGHADAGMGGPWRQRGQHRGPDVDDILRHTAHIFRNHMGGGAHVNIVGDTIEQQIRVPVDVMMRGGGFSFTYVVPASSGFTLQFRQSMGTTAIEADTPVGHSISKKEFDNNMTLILIPQSTQRYTVQGLDVIGIENFDVLNALAGEATTVLHPDGSTLRVEAPKKIKQGQMLRIPNRGLRDIQGNRGHYYVAMNLTVPTLDEQQVAELKNILKKP